MRLTAAQQAQYREQGYILFREPILPADGFRRLGDIFDRLVAEGSHLDIPHFQHPELLDFLLVDEVLDLVEPLLGPDFGLWSSHFIAKEPLTGKATPRHEDSAYWDGRFATFEGIATVWLALDEVDAENGAMSVLPGTHLVDGYTYRPCDPQLNVFPEEIENLDTSSKVTCELQSNRCSIHDSRIVHGASANTSGRRRCGYTMRYFSQHMEFNREHPDNRGFRIWHARGANPHENPVEK